MGDIIAKANGEIRHCSPAKETYSLEELQAIVGGHIEIIDLNSRYLVINEDGKLLRLKYNILATNWYINAVGKSDFIVGDVLLCEKEHIK